MLRVLSVLNCTCSSVISLYGDGTAGFLRGMDRSYKRFYRLLIDTQAFNHFIEERSFGCDRMGTMTLRRSGDLAFFDQCVRQIDEYDGETSLIEFDDVLPPRSCASVIVMLVSRCNFLC